MTVAELTALRDAAEDKRLEKLEDAKNAVLKETRAKLTELGLTLGAVLPTPASPEQGGRSGQGRKRRSDAWQVPRPQWRTLVWARTRAESGCRR